MSQIGGQTLKREGYVIGKSEGVSRDKAGARMKAKNAILNDFRQKTKAIATGRSENFFKETGENLDSEIYQTFESVQQSVWEGGVESWVEFKSTTVVEKPLTPTADPESLSTLPCCWHRSGAQDKKLLAAIKREKALATAMEQTKSYKKLLDDLERYKDKLD